MSLYPPSCITFCPCISNVRSSIRWSLYFGLTFSLVLLSQELAVTRKRILEAEYRQIREVIDRDEKEAMIAIDKEQEKGQSKLVSLMKKFNENVEKMNRTKSEINSLLDQSQSLTFLKVIQSMNLNKHFSALELLFVP